MMNFVRASTQYCVSTGNFACPANGTICFWIKPTTIAGSQYVFEVSNSYDVIMDAGYIRACLRRHFAKYLSSTVALTAGTEYHIACTHNSSVDIWIYINAALDVTDNQRETVPTDAPLYLGQYSGGGPFSVDATLGDVRSYDRILSLPEIETIYACRGTDGIVDGLTHRYLLNEKHEGAVASGSLSVKDIAGALDETPTNSPTYAGTTTKWRRSVV